MSIWHIMVKSHQIKYRNIQSLYCTVVYSPQFCFEQNYISFGFPQRTCVAKHDPQN